MSSGQRRTSIAEKAIDGTIGELPHPLAHLPGEGFGFYVFLYYEESRLPCLREAGRFYYALPR
ncbi:hypothetical protein C6I21_03695 [Alkalicoccus urumqiensis]|uniref:Uncharacterized protein n=1 Tax=Alkalicoccus urumqiensis TaxID=1548213 RepID=A0A2P6MJJ3_ALKUR|nr:hypothetical protein C6I21_03695 [Alkalicoccus urumqiensis]